MAFKIKRFISPLHIEEDPRKPAAKKSKAAKKEHHPGYKPLGDAQKMKGNSFEAQALNTINAKAQNKIKAKHKQDDLNTRFVKKGETLGLGHKVVGINKKTGDYFTRKGNRATVYKTSRRDAQRYSASIGKGYTPKITQTKIKHGYDSAGGIIERK